MRMVARQHHDISGLLWNAFSTKPVKSKREELNAAFHSQRIKQCHKYFKGVDITFRV